MNVKSLSSFIRSHISHIRHTHYMHATNVLFYNNKIKNGKTENTESNKILSSAIECPDALHLLLHLRRLLSILSIADFWFHPFSLYCVLVSRIIICYTSLRCQFTWIVWFCPENGISHEIGGCVGL